MRTSAFPLPAGLETQGQLLEMITSFLIRIRYGIGICKGGGNRSGDERNEFGGAKPIRQIQFKFSVCLPLPGYRRR